VLTGLIDAGEGASEAVARGIAYLLDQQRADGTWPHGDWLQANVPPDTFYILAEAAKHYPTEALAHYLDAA
jgi:Squalene-hopene cyclase C-terminal domain